MEGEGGGGAEGRKKKKDENKLYKFVQTLSQLHHYWLLLLDVEAPVLVHVHVT